MNKKEKKMKNKIKKMKRENMLKVQVKERMSEYIEDNGIKEGEKIKKEGEIEERIGVRRN